MSHDEIITISIAVIGSSVIKNGVGVGAGIFLLPVLALVLPPKLAIGLGAPAMLISDIVGVKNYWGAWDRKELNLLRPSAAVGVLLGCFLIKVMPDSVFKQCVGIFALLLSSLHILKMIRDNLHRSMLLSHGELAILLRSPICWFFGVLTLITVFLLIRRNTPSKKNSTFQAV